LQKFPFALEHIADVPGRNYAVLIDEARSSQGGKASRKMNEVLANVSLEEAGEMQQRGLSARIVRHTHSALHNALKQAVKWNILQKTLLNKSNCQKFRIKSVACSLLRKL